jgi:hypothetical protein
MCYFLYLASPLTLSEIRAMLPEGVTAHSAGSHEQELLRSLQRGTGTVAQLLVGRCSCAFLESSQTDPAEYERHLRERYRQLGLNRENTIAALERHRFSQKVPVPDLGWAGSLVDFIREHSRNARKSLYHLAFDSTGQRSIGRAVRELRVGSITPQLNTWLLENSPVLITH